MAVYFLSLLLLLLLHISASSAQPSRNLSSSFSPSDSPWTPNQNIILLSPNAIFAAGFRSLSTNSMNYTFSIWFHNISGSNVWSANDDSPVSSSATLLFSNSGELRLTDGNSSGRNLWPSAPTVNANATLVLDNDGSLVLGKWSSFLFPTDTILPNQTINGTTPLVSADGRYSFVNSTALVLNGNRSYWSAGNALMKLQDDGRILQANGASMVSSDLGDRSTLRKLRLGEDGNLMLLSYDFNQSKWVVTWQAIQEHCTIPGKCGTNYICMFDGLNPTYCVCPAAFRVVSDGRGGETCQLKTEIKRLDRSKFLRFDYVSYSGGLDQTNLLAPNFTTCRAWCLNNSTCLGFGFKYDGNNYCVLQLGRLLYGYWSPGTEMSTFLRVDESELDHSNFTGMTSRIETTCPIRIGLPLPPAGSNSATRNIAIICTLFVAELISGVVFFWAFLKKYIKYRDMARTLGLELMPTGGPKRFSYAELKTATNNFSNIVGKGGFGDVYLGELSDHRVIAVKCLKNVSGGDPEFWAEVTIIARMHHLNLVRLWGFCAEKGQRMLVYEFVPNGSLDKFLFPASIVGSGESKPLLDWNIRYRIALGVARAISYLHEECLEWVLHCDIKPENILLGDDFCPKLSDFGLAKLRKKEDVVSMSRLRGTRGYMAPEWLRSDPISPKADVYSFGMVLLEIVSGRRNNVMQASKMESADWYFPKWAFEKAFKEMRVEDLLDERIMESYDSRAHFEMVNRMVKTAMWCLQDRPEARPSMGKVAKMLEGTVEIMEPKKPTIFYLGQD
ncbi:G-type lectin S-receptor-like serine/threonine-protein kinase At1g34300 [Impatiens glandulifera]|uniref:G-type lectin S-receptor-like serine/threonine-protein kinase At1g34300 n=1 Tax=Impatiens glandulifera TaxID=253017 RepID=UPI001FB0E5DF|nr:G-type lectin S-receptor-like serine/threonine-protein kinase At1g34300 [Impatiens glandulifera]